MSTHNLRVLIVDDETAARRRLAIMLSELDVEVVGEARNGLEALQQIRERHPDVVLLDITMPEIDGFDVAQHLPEPKPLVVFQTAFGEYALEAFDHEAVDYLVKPVTLPKLQRALARARERIGTSQAESLSQDVLRQLRSSLQVSEAQKTRVLLREGKGHLLVAHSEIVLFHAKEGTVYAKTGQREFLTDYTLSDLESRLAGAFVRPSRSELVNVDQIAHVASNGDGSATLTLKNQQTIHVTRRRAAEIRQALAG